MDPAGNLTVLYSFTSFSSYIWGLVLDPAGNLYGTTTSGGATAWGSVFEVSSQGAYTLLHSFDSSTSNDGLYPMAGLVRDKLGNLYGTTNTGGEGGCGDLGCGVVFKVTP